MISETARYNESIGEWTIRGIAFAGNNVQEVSTTCVIRLPSLTHPHVIQKNPQTAHESESVDDELDLQHVYYTYK